MKGFLAVAIVAASSVYITGCATKKYVRNTAAPIQAKVDQVGEQTSKNGQAVEEVRTQVKQVDDRAQSGINAVQERASTADQHALTADQHAGEARAHADQAVQTAGENRQGLESLRQVVANLDDYKLQTSVSVPFGFDKHTLSKEAQQELDRLASGIQSEKRFFIAVEGYTDQTGSRQYNEVLSRNRADAVVEYLVGALDVPIYRIHMVGLGEQKPIDEGRTRQARAKNRRVEVKIYSADQTSAVLAVPATARLAERSSQ